MNKIKLYDDTLLLLQYNEKLTDVYKDVKNTNKAADFYDVVKPTADEIKDILDRWKLLVLDWVKYEKPKYLHPNQIESTYENVIAISVQAFFPDTREKRFMELIRSTRYIYEIIIEELKK
jgi:hypothetical protein